MTALRTSGVLAASLAFALLASNLLALGQAGCQPLDREALLRMVEGGLFSDDRIRNTVSDCGVTFIVDPADERRLRDAGASDDLLSLLTPPGSATTSATWLPLTDRRAVVYAQAGSFTMGSAVDDESSHGVTIEQGFWLDATEVTNEAFARFVAANPEWGRGGSQALANADGNYLSHWPTPTTYSPEQARHPVVYVSWHAARAYATWAGKRLPTEAEWEYAARAGTSGTYWWGDAFDAGRVHGGSGVSLGLVGGQAARNPWGFHEMIGSAAEWTSSAFVPYPYRSNDGREDPGGQVARTIRGGAYNHSAALLRVSNRMQMRPSVTAFNVGFRCLLDAR